MGELRETLDDFNALREEVSSDLRRNQTTVIGVLQATVDLGEEWTMAFCERYGVEVDDLVSVMEELDKITSPNLMALWHAQAFRTRDVSTAAIGAGVTCGVFLGLMLAEKRRRGAQGEDAKGP